MARIYLLFVHNYIPPEFFKKLLLPDFSGKGTPTKRQEEATYMNFLDFVEECEGIYNIYI